MAGGTIKRYSIDPSGSARLTVQVPVPLSRASDAYIVLLDGAELGRAMETELVTGKLFQLPGGSTLRLQWLKGDIWAFRDGEMLSSPDVPIGALRLVSVVWTVLYSAAVFYGLANESGGGPGVLGAATFAGMFLAASLLARSLPRLAAGMVLLMLLAQLVLAFRLGFGGIIPALYAVASGGSLPAPVVTLVFVAWYRKLPPLPASAAAES